MIFLEVLSVLFHLLQIHFQDHQAQMLLLRVRDNLFFLLHL